MKVLSRPCQPQLQATVHAGGIELGDELKVKAPSLIKNLYTL